MNTWMLRGAIVHTPRNPFRVADALEYIPDGGLVVEGTRIAAVGDFAAVRADYPAIPVHDCRPGLLLPGMVDAHVHFPQISVIGAMGLGLLDWLQTTTLPAECKFVDRAYAERMADLFLRRLAAHGVTSALVFGSHFPGAQDVFFEQAARSGLRITSGLVVSDRDLLPPLHMTPEEALTASERLIERWHGRGRLRYAVTPRFALSASGAMLDACRKILESTQDVYFQTHLNETPGEIAAVKDRFPDQPDYLAVYDAYGLVGPRSVFAHNVHPQESELHRLAAANASVAHCPSSNSFLGSGLFPMVRHLDAGVHVCLGSDVGGGTGFGMWKEGLIAYQVQRLRVDGFQLEPAHLLYLATRAGAEALGMDELIGDLTPGKEADVIWVKPRPHSTLETRLAESEDAEASSLLGAWFTLHGDVDVARVYVAGERIL